MGIRSSSLSARGWRSRWAAIGAAIAVALGGGGLFVVNAASSVPSSFVGIDPVRILDTRVDVGLAGPFLSPTAQDLLVTGSIPTTTGMKVVVPVGATAVSMNVTVVGPTADGFVSVQPADAVGPPSVSSLNFVAGDIVPNAVTSQLPTSGSDQGKIEITYNAFEIPGPTTEILVDVVGYYTETTGTPGPEGPEGPEGPPGVQGLPGLAGVEVVESAPHELAAGTADNSDEVAECPAGKTPIAGGAFQSNSAGVPSVTTNIADQNLWVVNTRPTPNGNGWGAAMANNTASTRYFVVYVVCAQTS